MAEIAHRIQEMINALSKKGSGPGGIHALIQMLGQVDRDTERNILQALDKQSPDLARAIREKHFTFEDLAKLDDRILKRALPDVHRTTLALALKGTTFELQDKVFRNLSTGAAKMLKDEMEFMGPKPKVLVEEAQREVTKELRRWQNVIL